MLLKIEEPLLLCRGSFLCYGYSMLKILPYVLVSAFCFGMWLYREVRADEFLRRAHRGEGNFVPEAERCMHAGFRWFLSGVALLVMVVLSYSVLS